MSLILDVLVGMTTLFKQQRALEVILVACQDMSDTRGHNTHAEQLFAELVPLPSPNVVAEAQQYTNEQTLDQLIQTLLRAAPTQRCESCGS